MRCLRHLAWTLLVSFVGTTAFPQEMPEFLRPRDPAERKAQQERMDQSERNMRSLEMDADTLLDIADAQVRLGIAKFGIVLDHAPVSERLAVRNGLRAMVLCGLRTVEVWPDPYRRFYLDEYRRTKDVLRTQASIESKLEEDLKSGRLAEAEFLGWGSRVEAIAGSCEAKLWTSVDMTETEALISRYASH